MYVGIDYGMGMANVDRDNGIRYGVISSHEVTQAWEDSCEPQYGPPTCPDCGSGAVIDLGNEYECQDCSSTNNSDDVFGDDPLSYTYEIEGYIITQSANDSDLFILKSPYYTRCAYCSPCAPGAGYVMSPIEEGIKSYCLGHDWFEEGIAPYPVYSVEG